MKRHNDIGAPLEPIFEHDHIDDFDELPCQYCNKNGKYASIPMQEYVSQTILAHQSNEGCWNSEDIDQEFRSKLRIVPDNASSYTEFNGNKQNITSRSASKPTMKDKRWEDSSPKSPMRVVSNHAVEIISTGLRRELIGGGGIPFANATPPGMPSVNLADCRWGNKNREASSKSLGTLSTSSQHSSFGEEYDHDGNDDVDSVESFCDSDDSFGSGSRDNRNRSREIIKRAAELVEDGYDNGVAFHSSSSSSSSTGDQNRHPRRSSMPSRLSPLMSASLSPATTPRKKGQLRRASIQPQGENARPRRSSMPSRLSDDSPSSNVMLNSTGVNSRNIGALKHFPKELQIPGIHLNNKSSSIKKEDSALVRPERCPSVESNLVVHPANSAPVRPERIPSVPA